MTHHLNAEACKVADVARGTAWGTFARCCGDDQRRSLVGPRGDLLPKLHRYLRDLP